MADQSFPYPPPHPLERLYVHDGLMMTADRWRLAHRYHRHRQNLHYQALYQPGVVYGLGVKLIPPPQNSSLHYRALDAQQGDARWLEIQPGIAIDIEGNPIVVDPGTNRTYRIAFDAPTLGKRTVYVVVKYIDPDALQYEQIPLTISERFRFDQTTSPPGEHEVELCRIELAPGRVDLKVPENVFSPGVNEINVLHRVQAQLRAKTYIKFGVITPCSEQDAYAHENCSYLVQSLLTLYPDFRGEIYSLEPSSQFVNLTDKKQCQACDLLYASAESLLSFNQHEDVMEILKCYLDRGGTLLVETPFNNSERERSIRAMLSSLQHQSQLSPQRVSSGEADLSWSNLTYEYPLPSQHPLRTQPFTFTFPPSFKGTALQISASQGVILVKGTLSEAWGVQGGFLRDEIRTAQELGINFLYFAWQRRHFSRLIQGLGEDENID